MPFTPYHFAPHAAAGLPFARRVNVFVFLAANVAVDIEPLLVLMRVLRAPLHGFCHSFTGGALVGALAGLGLWFLRRPISWLLGQVGLPAPQGLAGYLLSGVLGAWWHVVFDAVLYAEIRLLYPLAGNPLWNLVDRATLLDTCLWSFVPALIFWQIWRVKMRRGASTGRVCEALRASDFAPPDPPPASPAPRSSPGD